MPLATRTAALAGAVGLCAAAGAQPVEIGVIVESLAPEMGTFQTPFWVGFHDGSFDTYDLGSPASPALERIAEDGNAGPLRSLFAGPGRVDGVIATSDGVPPFGPGERAQMSFTLDAADNKFFSYASMLIPSNDAFVANGNPLAHQIISDTGALMPTSFVIMGSAVLDAGTEVNTEIPEHTAFFGQMTPDTGVDEGGVVHAHPGFMPPGSGGILDDPMFAAADFTAAGYQVARITIVPAPGAMALGGLGLLTLARRRR
ncbi:MAG: spondin domain-containing protein [Phycisphaerales bacterium JB039]